MTPSSGPEWRPEIGKKIAPEIAFGIPENIGKENTSKLGKQTPDPKPYFRSSFLSWSYFHPTGRPEALSGTILFPFFRPEARTPFCNRRASSQDLGIYQRVEGSLGVPPPDLLLEITACDFELFRRFYIPFQVWLLSGPISRDVAILSLRSPISRDTF